VKNEETVQTKQVESVKKEESVKSAVEETVKAADQSAKEPSKEP